MVMASNLAAYEDCVEILERALRTKVGIKIQTEDEGQAWHLRQRLHYTRKLLREKSYILALDDPSYGTCSYDILVIRNPIHDEAWKWWVHIERRAIGSITVEELDADPAPG